MGSECSEEQRNETTNETIETAGTSESSAIPERAVTSTPCATPATPSYSSLLPLSSASGTSRRAPKRKIASLSYYAEQRVADSLVTSELKKLASTERFISPKHVE